MTDETKTPRPVVPLGPLGPAASNATADSAVTDATGRAEYRRAESAGAASEMSPVEVEREQVQTMDSWLSEHIKTSPVGPLPTFESIAGRVHKPAAQRAWWAGWAPGSDQRRNPLLAWPTYASAAAALLVVVWWSQPAAVDNGGPTTAPAYVTAFSEDAMAGVQPDPARAYFSVIPQAGVTPAGALRGSGLRVESGPGQIGQYIVSLPRAGNDLNVWLATMRKSPSIRMLEPVVAASAAQ